MKIAFILNTYPVLYNTYHLNLIRDLIVDGVDVHLFAPNQNRAGEVHEGSEALLSRTHYLREFLNTDMVSRLVNRSVNHVNKLSSKIATHLADYIFRGKGCNYDAREHQALLNWSAWALPEVARYLRKERYDLVHGAFAARPATLARILGEMTDLPFTFEAHAEDLYVAMANERKTYERDKCQRAAAIFTISQYNLRHLIDDFGVDANRVAVFRVPFNRAFCDKIAVPRRDPHRLISVCRLYPIKGLSVGIEAFAKVADDLPDLRWDIIGDGPLHDSLNDQIQALGLRSRVRLLGRQTNEAALRAVASSAAFVLPCIKAPNGDRDGIPTVLIEAMYLGTPVISTSISGIPELITHEQTGMLVAPGDVDSLASSIAQVITQMPVSETLAKRGHEWVADGFYAEPTHEVFHRRWERVLL